MEKTKNTLVIPEEVSARIEAAQLNYEARQDLCAYMIGRGVDIKGESFQAYEAELADFKAEYELRKRELEAEFIKPAFPKAKSWRLDFADHTVTVEQ